MLRFKKVVPMKEKDQQGGGSSLEKAKNKEDQKKYEAKVRELRGACDNFRGYLYEEVYDETKISNIIEAFESEKTGFGKQMKKPTMLSRTSKLLHRMKKELSKLKSKSKNGCFDPQNVDQYKKAFEFKRENPKGGYIKRSAIDDIEVYNFFSTNKRGSILEFLTNMKEADDSRNITLKKTAENNFNKVKKFIDKLTQTINNANNVQNETDQTIMSIKNDQEIEQKYKSEIINELKEQKETLQKHINASQEVITNLKNNQQQAEKNIDNKNLCYERKNHLVESLDWEIESGVKVEKNLKLESEGTDWLSARIKKNIEEIKNGLFDCKTGTFIVKTKDDFEKMINYKDKIEKVVVEGDIKKINEIGVSGLKRLVEVNLNDKCKTIGHNAFKECENLVTIDLSNVQKIGRRAFYKCQNLKGVENVGINLNKVTLVDDETFKDCESITKVILGENCKEIRYGAFSGCTNLREINLENVQVIEERAFIGCTNLAGLNLKSVTDINENAFKGSNIKAISKNNITFPTNKDAEDVVKKEILGDNVDPKDYDYKYDEYEIGDFEVNGDTITVSSAITYGVENSFGPFKSFGSNNNKVSKMNVRNVQKLTKKIKLFDDYFMKNRLEEVNLDDKCRAIGDKLFYMYLELKSINLEKVQRIGSFSFVQTALETVDLSSAIEIKSSAFTLCNRLKSVKLGANCKKINSFTFCGCKVLSSINLENVEKIGENAFGGCIALKTIDLSKVTEIAKYAFKGCTGLATVTLPKNEKAADIKRIICEQTGKEPDDGINPRTINFINDPEPAE